MGTRRKTTTSQHYPKIQSSNLKGENTLMTCIAFNCVSNSNSLVLNDPDVDEDVKEKKNIYVTWDRIVLFDFYYPVVGKCTTLLIQII